MQSSRFTNEQVRHEQAPSRGDSTDRSGRDWVQTKAPQLTPECIRHRKEQIPLPKDLVLLISAEFI